MCVSIPLLCLHTSTHTHTLVTPVPEPTCTFLVTCRHRLTHKRQQGPQFRRNVVSAVDIVSLYPFQLQASDANDNNRRARDATSFPASATSKSIRSLQKTNLLLNTTEVLLAGLQLSQVKNMIYFDAREHDFLKTCSLMVISLRLCSFDQLHADWLMCWHVCVSSFSPRACVYVSFLCVSWGGGGC